MEEWEPKFKEMIPSYGESLGENPELLEQIHALTAETLGLREEIPVVDDVSGEETKVEVTT